ncbi:hypothetical protein [Nonomuraea sp. NPDC050643]|uniref:helix-turn-helix domain-containing protein n=1 Tax=Nonomuraea sp. NPDC050643 TaxID=3155660 RepID=UPI0033E163F3
MSVLSDRIREGREYLNFPPDRMAEELGVMIGEYEAFEAGQAVPSGAQIAAIAWICGTTPGRLHGAHLQAGPDVTGSLVCAMSDGPLTHDDVYELARFAEMLRVRATPDPRVASRGPV